MNEEINKKVENLRPFTRILMTIGELPTSYLMSMTYYEQIIWFTKYLKDSVIPALNNNAQAVEELQHLFINLQNYVNNYFDNLDVQEEINNKLDEMVENGTLQEIIANYLNSKAIFGFDNVASMKESTNLINGSYAKTLGYYTKNDGGMATYKIRTITNDDVVDEATILSLNNDELIAELIINDNVNVLQLGAKADNSTDNTSKFQIGLNKAIEINKPLYIPTGKNGKYVLNNSLNLTGEGICISIIGDKYNTSYTSTHLNFISILCKNDFIIGNNQHINLSMSDISIGLYNENQEYNAYSVFKNIIFDPLKMRHCYFSNIGYFINNGTISYVSDVYDNNFYLVNNAFIKTYLDTDSSLLTKHYISDSIIHNNYIHGNRHTNPVLIDGICDYDSRLENNFIDYFKYLYTCNIPNVTLGNFGMCSNNIFSRCFRVTNRLISATFIENNFQGWTRTILNSDFDNQDTFMQNGKVGAFISDPVDNTYETNKEEYRYTKLINNKLKDIDYFVWLSGTDSTSSQFMIGFEESGTIALEGFEDTYANDFNNKYFYVRAVSGSARIVDFNLKIKSLDYIDLSSTYQTAPSNCKESFTYNDVSYDYLICRKNQHVWLGDGLYIGKFDSSQSSWDRFVLVKLS